MIDSVHVRLDRDRPLQAQIVAGLRDAIASGRVATHDRLPGTRTLAAQLGVSRMTVALAIDALIAEGYVVARPRSGVFVVTDPPRLARSAKPAGAAAAGRKLRRSRRARTHQAAPPIESRSRPLAFPLSRPALDAFPIDTWRRLLSRRAARTSLAQLDYGGGLPQLARAIAALVSAARGVRVDPAQVMIVGGGPRALALAAAARAAGVVVAPLASCQLRGRAASALVLGFGSVPPPRIRAAIAVVAEVVRDRCSDASCLSSRQQKL